MRGIVGLACPVDLYLVSIRIGVHPVPAVRVIAGVAESEAIKQLKISTTRKAISTPMIVVTILALPVYFLFGKIGG